MQISLSPSTSGDQVYPQPIFAVAASPKTLLTSPAMSLGRFLRQTSLPPLVSTHTRSPLLPSANSRLPSTVGVESGPRLQVLDLKSQTGPILADQSSLPLLLPSRAMINSRSPRAPIVYTTPPTTAGAVKPMPASLYIHARAGPSLGQVFNSPVSLEMASRLG